MPTFTIRAADENGNPATFTIEAPQKPTLEEAERLIDAGQAVRAPEAFGEPPGVSGGPPTLPPSPSEQVQHASKSGAHWAAPMVLPAAGSVAGDMLLTPVGLGPVGAAAGGLAGQWANAQLGLEPPLTMDDALLAAGLPLGAELAVKGGRELLKSTRGGKMVMKDLLRMRGMETLEKYMQTLPEDAIRTADAMLQKTWDIPLSTRPIAELLQARGVPADFIDEVGLSAYMQPSLAQAGIWPTTDMPLLHYQGVAEKASDIFAKAMREWERTGTHEAKRRAEHAMATLDGIDQSFQDTLRSMANQTGPGVTAQRAMLSQLAKANRRWQVGGELQALSERFISRDADGVGHFDLQGFFRELHRSPTDGRRDPLYDHLRASLKTVEEKTPLAKSLADLQRRYRKGIQIVPESAEGTAGVAIGRGLGRFGVGAALGHLTGLPEVVTGAGYAGVSEMMSHILMSEPGRKFLRIILDKTGGKIPERTLAGLASAVRPAALGVHIPGMEEGALSQLMGPQAAQAAPLPEPAIRTMPGALTTPMGGRQLPTAGPLAAPIGASGGIGSVASAAPAGPLVPPAVATAGSAEDLYQQLYNAMGLGAR